MLERLLGTVPVERFLAEHYLKVPFALTGAAQELQPHGSWSAIAEILAAPQPDVMVVRSNERYAGPLPTSEAAARALVAEGYTLLVRHAERHLPPLQEWATGLQQDLDGPVNIHLYCTPASEFGFGWHYDAEEVLIVQTTGSKEYSLRKNTVNPWPIEETLPENMRYEREIMPLMRCRLQGGDWLYIPSGYWHMGRAEEEAISLAIGVMPTTGVDWFDFVRRHVLDSLRWRQRFPVLGDGDSPLERKAEAYEPLLDELADDLNRMLRDPVLRQAFLRRRA